MKWRLVWIYFVLLALTLFVLALIWHWQMAGAYFVSKNRGVILDFWPPFVRPGVSGEFYIKPPSAVYAIWAVYLTVSLLAPALGAWFLDRLHERALEKAW
jgi:hypothetical protein